MICHIKSCSYSICGVCNNMNEFDCEYKDYRAIGTIKECGIAVEKQIPKKPKEQGTDEKTHYKCPECGWIPLTIYSDGCHLGNKPKYCEHCGQAIDWNEVD